MTSRRLMKIAASQYRHVGIISLDILAELDARGIIYPFHWR